MWQGKQRGGEHPLVWLRDVVWNCRTGFLFARLADERLAIEAVGDVKKIADSALEKASWYQNLLGVRGGLANIVLRRAWASIQLGKERKLRDMLLCGGSSMVAVVLRA